MDLESRIRDLEGSDRVHMNTEDVEYVRVKTALLENPSPELVERYVTFVGNESAKAAIQKILLQTLEGRRPIMKRGTTNGASDDNKPTLQVTPKRFEDLNSESDIIGAQREKLELFQQFTMPISRPTYYVDSVNNRMLLYGPPGTGKTMFANSTANTMRSLLMGSELYYFSEPTGAYKGKLVGQTEQNLREIFRVADNYARFGTKEAGREERDGRSVIFMDEFESLARSRGDDQSASTRASVPELLQLLGDRKSLEKIVFVAATNLPWELDSAILRRFDVRLFVDLPSRDTRRFITYSIMRKRFKAEVQDMGACGDAENNWNQDCERGVSTLMRMTGFRKEFFTNLTETIQGLGTPISEGLYNDWIAEHSRDVSAQSLGIAYSNSDMNKIVNRAINIYAGDVIAYETYLRIPLEERARLLQLYDPNDEPRVTAMKRIHNRTIIAEVQKRNQIQNVDTPLPFDYLLRNAMEQFEDSPVFFLYGGLSSYFKQAFLEYPPTVDLREYVNLLIYYFTNKNPLQLEKKKNQR